LRLERCDDRGLARAIVVAQRREVLRHFEFTKGGGGGLPAESVMTS